MPEPKKPEAPAPKKKQEPPKAFSTVTPPLEGEFPPNPAAEADPIDLSPITEDRVKALAIQLAYSHGDNPFQSFMGNPEWHLYRKDARNLLTLQAFLTAEKAGG